jgi:hypothetical protein
MLHPTKLFLSGSFIKQQVLLNRKLHVLLIQSYYKLFHREYQYYFNIQAKDYVANMMLPKYLDPIRLDFRLNRE